MLKRFNGMVAEMKNLNSKDKPVDTFLGVEQYEKSQKSYMSIHRF